MFVVLAPVSYTHLYELFSAGDVVDSVTISERLRQSGHYDPDTTPQYLLYLAEFTPSSANTQRYARIVYEKAMLRALISASEQIAQNCMAEAGEFSLLMDQAEQLIYDLSHGRRINEMRPIAEVVDEADVYKRQMSLEAPVEMSSRHSASAARPPKRTTISSRISCREE